MNILLVSQYYPPEIGAPQARLSEMAEYWVKSGHTVTVYTAMPNHPTGVLPESYKGKILCKEKVKGVNIVRHWLYTTSNKGFLKKILSHLTFMFSVLLLSLFRDGKPDVVIVSSPTFFVVFSAWILSIVNRSKFIFEVRDLWPGIFVELGVLKNKVIIFVLESMELFLYRRAHAVVVVTDSFKENISRRGINLDKIWVVKNGVNLEFFGDIQNYELNNINAREKLGFQKDDIIVLYIGAHGISHALDKILLVAKECVNEKQIKFLFVGEGAVKESLEKYTKENNLKNIHFHSGVKREKVLDFYKMSDINLVPLKNISGFSEFIPSKIFEIFASCRPIVGSVRGEAAKILEDSNGAIVVEPENVDAIVAGISKLARSQTLRKEMGTKGRDFVETNFNRNMLASKYLNIMKNC